MTTVAVVVLVLAGLLIWGGLAVSILLLRRDGRRADAVEAAGPAPASGPQDHPGGGRSGDVR